MLLELGQAVSFFATILALCAVGIVAFFQPATRWDDRLLLALPRLVIAACTSLASALLFTWPTRSNPDAHQPLLSTLPLRLFFWGTTAMALLFVAIWYLACGGPTCPYLNCR
ncbi:MAG: hypothetical protein V4555_10815 [Acidobacteriota bacterium]